MSEQNVQVIKDVYAAFGRGDIPGILSILSEDAQLHHSGSAEAVPWGGATHKGRDGWGEFFGQLAATLEPEEFAPETYVAQGDHVVAVGRYRFKAKSTGKSFSSPWAMVWQFRDGKPVDCQVFEDTEAMASAVRG